MIETLFHPEQELPLLKQEEFRALLEALVIIRHGKTRLNEEKRLQGSSDEALSESGKTEMIAQAEALVDVPHQIALIISSTMKRATQTSEIFGQILELPTQTLEGLEEYGHGDWEGEEVATILADKLNEAWTGRRISHELENGVPPHHGESFLIFLERVNQALHQLNRLKTTFTLAPESKIAIVAHSEVIRAIRFLYLLANELPGSRTISAMQKFEQQFSFTPNGDFIKIPHGLVQLNLENYSLQSIE